MYYQMWLLSQTNYNKLRHKRYKQIHRRTRKQKYVNTSSTNKYLSWNSFEQHIENIEKYAKSVVLVHKVLTDTKMQNTSAHSKISCLINLCFSKAVDKSILKNIFISPWLHSEWQLHVSENLLRLLCTVLSFLPWCN